MIRGYKSGHFNISQEEEERLARLFDRLDVNKDGKIDVKDLTVALHEMEVAKHDGHTQTFFDTYDMNRDGHIEFADFVRYVIEHERQLRLSFAAIDCNRDGFIDKDEIVAAFRSLGMNIDEKEAQRLLKKMDKDKTLQINWSEWRDYLLFHPSELRTIAQNWRHANVRKIDLFCHESQLNSDFPGFPFQQLQYQDSFVRVLRNALRAAPRRHAALQDFHLDLSPVHSQLIDLGEDSLVPEDFSEIELQMGLWWRHLTAGAAAGMVSRTCTAPLDRLKVLLQVHATRSNNLGIYTGFCHMLEEGGVRSLWRGNGINVLKIAPESALKFMSYEQIKRLMKAGVNRELGITERFAAGSLAGAISQSTIYPMEVLKTRLALRKTGQYQGIWDCACKIYRQEGVKSFYRGYVPNLLGIIPYAGIDLAIYETLKRLYIQNHSDGAEPGILVLLTCGTASSTCGQLASYPLALVRTKLQAKDTTVTLNSGTPNSMLGLIRNIIQTDGPLGLYRGITPNFMKVAPAVSISYVVYEHVRKLLGVEMT